MPFLQCENVADPDRARPATMYPAGHRVWVDSLVPLGEFRPLRKYLIRGRDSRRMKLRGEKGSRTVV